MIVRHRGTTQAALNSFSGAGARSLFDSYANAEMRGFGFSGFGDATSDRMAQGQNALAGLNAAISVFQKQVDSPPWGTSASVVGGWRTLLNTVKNVRDRRTADLSTAAQSDAAFQKWLDNIKVAYESTVYGMGMKADTGLLNALVFTARETGATVGAKVQDVMTAADWLTKPLTLALLVGGGLLVFAFARGGGSIVSVRKEAPKK